MVLSSLSVIKVKSLVAGAGILMLGFVITSRFAGGLVTGALAAGATDSEVKGTLPMAASSAAVLRLMKAAALKEPLL